MSTLYRSTRDENAEPITASQAVLQGLSPDGGLYVPTKLTKINVALENLVSLTYQELAYQILQPFFSDYTAEELRNCINAAYADNFSTPVIAPVTYYAGNAYLELFHGPTIAFKDIALQLLPHLLTTAAKKNNSTKEIVILTATSGDTGKAAMAGFANVDKTQICVFYPKDGVSPIQEKQMVTQTGNNTHVIGITGNFDVAQTNVKNIFNNKTLVKKLADRGYQFSSANSINIGRLFPQIVYYFYAYGQLIKDKKIKCGQKVNFSVPTGNFGDILAGYFAKKLGLPINKLICASNKNNVLTDFFNEGVYDKKRPFYVTSSPSMDILVSSNLERLLFYISNEDAKTTADLMSQLNTTGQYSLTDLMKANLTDFAAGYASEEQTLAEIARVYSEENVAIDPHTAVASAVANQYKKATGDLTPMIVVSTASPYKFPQTVLSALGDSTSVSGLESVKLLHEKIKTPLPETVKKLFKATTIHNTVVTPEKMEQAVKQLLLKEN
ncbi:threonine synthase [Ligilactobacillus sp. WILCCON 0076]|uniref:Threonine synthase n=1 Tax=Ligilactobacillus ubinensis TaxID=2876789 RepID=A0A9X2FKZ1_9LACO|nr:threonine synthase [Ligilactobacillus ubinensis]MCP0887602.1 threonine synthase [Ligilactobacillus ubinensis]